MAAALLALGVLAGCTTDEPSELTLPSPSATPESPSPDAAPEPEPEPSPEDPFAVPDEIDAAYVERVLNEINRIDAELTRDILRRPVDPDALALPEADQEVLESLYADPILTLNQRGTLGLFRSGDEREDLISAEAYGQLIMSVEEVLSADKCIIARIDRDFSEVDAELDTDSSDLAFVFLLQDETANATGWKLSSLVESDAPPGSADEEALRSYSAVDLEDFRPEPCQ